ncbi:hypothetical protein D8I24_1839 [Cupriavidus necator H850]|nr:hypothetical protein D8I24_1839 [Cupriavidus necator H850]
MSGADDAAQVARHAPGAWAWRRFAAHCAQRLQTGACRMHCIGARP